MREIFCFFGEKEDFLPYAQPQICIYKKKMLTLHAENIPIQIAIYYGNTTTNRHLIQRFDGR